MIVTSQVNPKAWMKLFEDPAIAEAVTDRLQNPSTKIALKGGRIGNASSQIKKRLQKLTQSDINPNSVALRVGQKPRNGWVSYAESGIHRSSLVEKTGADRTLGYFSIIPPVKIDRFYW